MSKLLRLILSIGVCQAAGLIGSIFTASSISSWYASLNKPSILPPNFVFAPVWTILYLLMGVSLYLVWETKKSKKRTEAIQIFFVQLALNVLWSIAFFGLQSPIFALIIIILLWLSIYIAIRRFSKISKNASYLLYPYIAWVSFAAYLNFSIWVLNR